jgi:hypothetical protein
MLRSIVYQIWGKNSRLFPLLRDRYRGLKRTGSSWKYDDLKSALQLLHQIDFDLKVIIAVDGMDEFDND